MSAEAWVTLATNDSYALGALVLAHSLRRVGTTRLLVVLITPGVTDAMRQQLMQTFDLVESVNVLDSRDSANLALLSRPDLGVTFTKLHCWRLTQFSKCVFLDADTLVLQPCDELFDREELSAAPDAGWPDCFNSGVFVYRPSNETYAKLLEFGVSHGSFDGGDQGLLNSFFSDWATKDISRHLPFIYNMCSSAVYSYLPAFKKFGQSVRIAHFIGACKPWMQSFDSEAKQVRASPGQEHQLMLLQLWWEIFCQSVHPHLSGEMRHRTLPSFPWTEPSPPTPPPQQCPMLKPRWPPDFGWSPPPSLSTQPTFPSQPTPMPANAPPMHLVGGGWRPQEIPIQPTNAPDFACCPNYPQNDPKMNPMPLNNSSGKTATDMSVGDGEMPCMEVSSQPRIPIVPHTTTQPSLEQSSVCLPVTTVTKGVEEEEISKNSLHGNAGVHHCALLSTETEGGLAAAFSHMTLGAPKTDAQRALEEQLRREAWERGQVDYLGKDSFDNVWMKIMQTLTSGPPASTGPSVPPPSPAPAAPAPPPAPQAPPPPASAPQEPAPVVPTPTAPAAPAPAAPAPAAPAPAAPAPAAPAPVAPAPAAPAPVAPAPAAPTPVAPAPVTPAPIPPSSAPVAPSLVQAAAPHAPSVPSPAPIPPSPTPKEPPVTAKVESAATTPLPPSPAAPAPTPVSPPTSPQPPSSPESQPSPPLPKQKPAAPEKQAKAAEEAGAQGQAAPVAPKRKGGQQQAAGGKGGGKSGGQKGKK